MKKIIKKTVKRGLQKHHFHIFTFLCVVFVVAFVYNFFEARNNFSEAQSSLTDGLVGYWNFDEGSGIVASDASKNDNTGTLINGPVWVEGKVGKALEFDGVNDKVLVGDKPSLDISGDAMSISAWINSAGANAVNQYSHVVGKSNIGNTPYAAYLNTSNRAYVMGLNGTNTCAKQSGTYDNEWNLITTVYNGSNISVYVNGELKGTCSKSGKISVNNDPFIIGDKGNGNNSPAPFKGKIDEVRVYNRALSADEVLSIYNNVVPKDTTLPSIEITFPANLSSVSGRVSVTATASDNIAVSGVQFILDGVNLGSEDLTYPYSVIWDTTNISNGAHVLSAVARDSSDNTEVSESVSVVVENIIEPLDVTTYEVGPTKKYKKPSEVAGLVNNDDVVLIDAGVYEDDFVVWKSSAANLTLRGVGGRAHITMTGKVAISNRKALWVIDGKNTLIENIEFSGAKVPDANGAGIRGQKDMTIKNSYFHDNENGVLSTGGSVTIESSEFWRNGISSGKGAGLTHNIYVSSSPKLTIRNSYIHESIVGHNIKSRALENHILYNRITDDTYDEKTGGVALGTGGYSIDLSNGGLSYVIGNVVEQGQNSLDKIIIAYGAEGLKTTSNQKNELYLVNNTLVNNKYTGSGDKKRPSVTFVRANAGTSIVKSINNLYLGLSNSVGSGVLFSGVTAVSEGDIKDPLVGVVNKDLFNFKLAPDSAAINAGVNPGSANDVSLTPTLEYVHPIGKKNRSISGALDVGAFEYFRPGGATQQ